jgi:hypothetical protein
MSEDVDLNDSASVLKYVQSLNETERKAFANGFVYGSNLVSAIHKASPEVIAKWLRDCGRPNEKLEAIIQQRKDRANAPWWKFWI